MSPCRSVNRWCIALLMAIACPAIVLAHGMDIHPALLPDKLRVTVLYDDDTPARNATVKLINESGAIVITASTNDQGVVEWPRPPAGEYLLKVDDGQGHARTRKLLVADGGTVITPGNKSSDRWLTIVGGLAIIALLSGVLRWFLRGSKKKPNSSTLSQNPDA